MEKESQGQMEKKVGCLMDKALYHEIISGRIQCNCAFCDIPMSKCEYWIHRREDKKKKTETWKDCLLGFLTGVIILCSISCYAQNPQEFAKKYESYSTRIEYHSVNGTLFKTFFYHKWKSEITNKDGKTTYSNEVEEAPIAWMITGAVMTEIGIMFLPLVCTEMVDNAPKTVYLGDYEQFRKKMPEREV